LQDWYFKKKVIHFLPRMLYVRLIKLVTLAEVENTSGFTSFEEKVDQI